LLDIDGTVIP